MIVRYPEYYEEFACIAGKCEDTCCSGWEIDIDDETYEYYRNVPGEFGETIRSRIKEYEETQDCYETHGFYLEEGKRCPFLNKNGLCDIILKLGEDALSFVCANTPRNYLEYGGAREISISPSCGEAGRLILGTENSLRFVEKEIPGTLRLEESEEELRIASMIKKVRDVSIQILQDRTRPVKERLCLFLCYAGEVQEQFNRETIQEEAVPGKEEIPCIWDRCRANGGFWEGCSESGDQAEAFACFHMRLALIAGMECIGKEWESYIENFNTLFPDTAEGQKAYTEYRRDWEAFIADSRREYEYEQMAVYYAFLLLARSVDDLNFWGKAQLVAVSFLVLRDMGMLRFAMQGRTFTKADQVSVLRVYAKETEHSQENMDYLEEELLFDEIYHLEGLCRQIF